MRDLFMPREGAKFIAEHSKDVTLDKEKLRQLSEKLYDAFIKTSFSLKQWKSHPLNPKAMNDESASWVFVSDVLNFSFWADDIQKRCVVKYGGENYHGYWSLCAAINRALDEKIDILNPEFYASVTIDQLQHILRHDEGNPMPLMQERVDSLNQAGRVLMEKYDGKFVNVIKAANKSAKALLKIIVSDFPSFRDEATFEGKTVAFYKRAQILIGDIWGCFEGQGLGEFTDIDEITAFADYRIPQLLAYFGVLNYTEPLMKRLEQGTMFVSGERQEVEIRGLTLHVIELLKEEMRRKLETNRNGNAMEVNSILIDYYLWGYRRDFAELVDRTPMHKIRCIYY